MSIQVRPLSEITQQAIELLSKELGIVETVRFLNQFTTGYGNYTEEREALFKDLAQGKDALDVEDVRALLYPPEPPRKPGPPPDMPSKATLLSSKSLSTRSCATSTPCLKRSGKQSSIMGVVMLTTLCSGKL